jgi:putative ABC transport system ATP-binding protein
MIVVENLSLSFDQKPVISKLSFRINKGEKAALTGSSGSGKTTLLNLLAGFITDYTGTLEIDGKSLNERHLKYIRNRFAWVPQNVSLNQEYVMDLFDVTFAFFGNKKHKPDEKAILELFKNFKLEDDILKKKFNEISIGQKQRVLLCNALLMKKPILIIDEPTAALDNETKTLVCDYILGIKDLTVIAATHDDYWIGKSNRVIDIQYEKP